MKYILLLIFVASTLVASQPTNLQVISNSIDSIVAKSTSKIYNKKIKIKSKYDVIAEKLESELLKVDSSLIITKGESYGTQIVLDSIYIEYKKSTNERLIFLIAQITTLADDNIVSFTIPELFKDTINTDIISQIEDETFPFTKGKMIEKSSFWDDAIEPVVYVGAAAVIVYLLFTVRSK